MVGVNQQEGICGNSNDLKSACRALLLAIVTTPLKMFAIGIIVGSGYPLGISTVSPKIDR
jgi:hypothetical protein